MELVAIRLEKSFLYQSKTVPIRLACCFNYAYVDFKLMCSHKKEPLLSSQMLGKTREMEQSFKLLKQMKSSKTTAGIQW